MVSLAVNVKEEDGRSVMVTTAPVVAQAMNPLVVMEVTVVTEALEAKAVSVAKVVLEVKEVSEDRVASEDRALAVKGASEEDLAVSKVIGD